MHFKKYLIAFITVIVLAAAGVPSVYFFRQYQIQKYRTEHPQEALRADVAEIVTRVGKLMILPTGEEPTIVIVANVDQLKDQSFFANAQNGDQVLIYMQARRAILYRPAINKIITVGPVNFASTSGTLSAP